MHARELVRFLEELAGNNNRAWFVMNKPRYDILRAEFLELVIALVAGIARFDPAVAYCNPKKALFRINRDLRFSADKRPYKTQFSASITASGLKKPSQGGGAGLLLPYRRRRHALDGRRGIHAATGAPPGNPATRPRRRFRIRTGGEEPRTS
jgi:hypothetical protein